jgi:glycosyltransferase involved in cell wall biosynthesis
MRLIGGDGILTSKAMLTAVMDRAAMIKEAQQSTPTKQSRHSRLAWVTPMPPDKTGIAEYSFSLLDDLSRHYEVTVITDSGQNSQGKLRCRSTDWLKKNGWRFDRICYHIGNSPYHRKIRECLELWPGAVVLHEFFLGDLEFSFESWMGDPNRRWMRELYVTHGYGALVGAQGSGQPFRHLRDLSCNGSILKRALGVIVHSQHAAQLVTEQIGQASTLVIEQVPMARKIQALPDRREARDRLGLNDEDILVCSFGMTGASKFTREIAEAWQEFSQVCSSRSTLAFVGSSSVDPYGAEIEALLREPGYAGRAFITGWISTDLYSTYLAACDIAVQLRMISRGETSAAVLDCLCAGIPTIVNRLGSFAELQEDRVLMLPAEPNGHELATALQKLGLVSERRRAIAQGAASLQAEHCPSLCAATYRKSLERIYSGQRTAEYRTIQSIGGSLPLKGIDPITLCQTLVQNFPRVDGPHQLFIDVSAIARSDYKTGIQRVVRAIILEFIHMGIKGYRVEPVWLSSTGGRWHYRYARRWTSQLLGLDAALLDDQPIESRRGDRLFIADLTGGYLLESERCNILPGLVEQGVSIQAIVYDILPLQLPQYFPKEMECNHAGWLSLIAKRATSLLCISEAVATETRTWLMAHQPETLERVTIDWFHLGADLENSSPSLGMPEDLDRLKERLQARCTFLMVGTIEPRKGYAQVIGAFEQLLEEGYPFNLVIVGKVGWMMEGLIHQLRTHPSFNNGIFWYESASDQFVRWLYQECQCLIAASEGEGFGLPLIEAALHAMPMLVRDLPVFREVAGDGAMYFSGSSPQELAASVLNWHQRFCTGEHPDPGSITWQTWNQSARQLLQKMDLENET